MMTRILLVEDEPEKKRLIAQALLQVDGVREHNIDRADDLVSARRFLEEHTYGLLILDINIPRRVDEHAELRGGLEILRALKRPGRLKSPDFIIGITAYDEAFSLAEKEFGNLIWTLT
jgi:CheY-like chemotaxis protein